MGDIPPNNQADFLRVLEQREITPLGSNTARQVDLRVVAALQRVDSDNVVTPEGWRPGDDVLLPPYQDQASALDATGDACWFHRTRPDKQAKAGR